MESHLSRHERIYFNSLGSHAAVEDWLEERGVVKDPAGGASWGKEEVPIVRGWDGKMGVRA